MSTISLKQLVTLTEVEESFMIMKQLRRCLKNPKSYAEQVDRQFKSGYKLMAALQDDILLGLIGYRELENLVYGRFIYVDDLVVDSSKRMYGLGSLLLGSVRQEAKSLGCSHLVLDTGLHKTLAQRFYAREGMLVQGMHFVYPLTEKNG